MSEKDISSRMKWYKFTIESVGVHDMGYEVDHSKWYDGDSDHVVGGVGWELRKYPRADIRQTRTLRDCVVVYENRDGVTGLYVSLGVLNALGIASRVWSWHTGEALLSIRFGTASFFLFTAELEQEIEMHVGCERRSDRERFVQERNAGVWNSLLGLCQEWQIEPAVVL